MSSQSKIIKDIFSIYDTILENKLNEVDDVYPDVDFKDGVVGNSRPSQDNINLSLLQDIETAAKYAGVKVDVTTAVSGHDGETGSGHTSRHSSGNAVDIRRINGKDVSLSNHEDADKFVNALVSMGYAKNQEVSPTSTPKSVLTFGFGGHDNHVHVSNMTNQTSAQPTNTTTGSTTGTTSTNTSTTTTSSTDSGAKNFARGIGQSILGAIGINEGRFYSTFGNNYNLSSGKIILPKDSNPEIKSPVDGTVRLGLDKVMVDFDFNGEPSYIEYDGIVPKDIRSGKKVKKGDILGEPISDVTVRIHSANGKKIQIDPKKELEKTKNKKIEHDSDYRSPDNEYSKLLRRGYRNLKNSFKIEKKDKLEENINRIKGLLK